MPPSVGEVWTHNKFFRGKPADEQRAHLVVLAVTKYSVTWRKLTKQATGRPQHPRCCSGPPAGFYPSFYLGKGVLASLPLDTWVDLLLLDDEDALDVSADVRAGELYCSGKLPDALVCKILRCALQSSGTANYQAKQIQHSVAALGCP
jgi:hypothetical protein